MDQKDELKDRVGSTYCRATIDNKNFVRSIPGGQGKGVYYLHSQVKYIYPKDILGVGINL